MENADRGRAPGRVARLRGRRLRHRRQLYPYYAFRAGEAVAAAVPTRAVHAAAAGIAMVFTLVAPRRFDGLRANLRHVVGPIEDRRLERMVRANVRNLARSWVEVLSMRARATELDQRLRVSGIPNIDAALARGHGVLVVSMHFGAWELGLGCWTLRGNRLALLAERLDPPELFARICGARGALGVEVIPIDTRGMREADPALARRLGASATREVMRVLRGGGAVATALDRDLIGNGRSVEFFGEAAPLPIGVIELAIRARAAILPVVMGRDFPAVNARIYDEVGYDPDAVDRDAEVLRTARAVLGLFEQLIRANPEQWNVLDPVWPRPPLALSA